MVINGLRSKVPVPLFERPDLLGRVAVIYRHADGTSHACLVLVLVNRPHRYARVRAEHNRPQ